jgi:hypothetical protein
MAAQAATSTANHTTNQYATSTTNAATGIVEIVENFRLAAVSLVRANVHVQRNQPAYLRADTRSNAMSSVNLGHITVSSGLNTSTNPAETSAMGNQPASVTGRPLPSTKVSSVALAQQSTPFTIKQPTSLPSPALTVDFVQQIKNSPSGPAKVFRIVTLYKDPNNRGQWVTVKQSPIADFGGTTFTVPAEVQQIQISGQPAALYTLSPIPGTEILTAKWEQGDFVMDISAVGFSVAQLVQTAASMR